MRRSFHYPAGIKAVGSRYTLAFSCVFVINFPLTLISEKAVCESERERERERRRESGSRGEDWFCTGEGWYRLWHIKGYSRLWIEEGIEAFTIKKVLFGLCVSCIGRRRASRDDGKRAVSGSSMITLPTSHPFTALALWCSASIQHFASPQHKFTAFYNPKQKGWQKKENTMKSSDLDYEQYWMVYAATLWSREDHLCHIS